MAWRLHPVAGAVAFFYAAAMAFALVYLGEHYVVDLLAGLIVAVVVWKLVWWRWSRERREWHSQGYARGEAPVVKVRPSSTPGGC